MRGVPQPPLAGLAPPGQLFAPYSRIVSSIRSRVPSATGCSSDLSTRDEGSSSASSAASCPPVPHSAPATAAGVAPAGKTENRSASSRSAGVSSSQLHSTTARSVRCRGSAVRLPPVSGRNRSASRQGDLGERQRPQPGGGELDRQRKPVKPPHDVGDQRARRGVEREIRADRHRPVGEQAHGGILAERRDDEKRLPGDGRLSACRHDPQPRAALEQRVRQLSAHQYDKVLAVVEDEQGAGIGKAVKQPGSRVPGGNPLCAVREQARFPQPDRAEQSNSVRRRHR